jgi:hypothetical protein
MKINTAGVWLLALFIPVFILTGAQIDTTSGPSIGGGGYDLGPFLYSWLLVIVTVVWSLCLRSRLTVSRPGFVKAGICPDGDRDDHSGGGPDGDQWRS